MRSGISRTASAPGWQEAGVLNGATPNRCMNIAMKSATRPCTRRPPLKAILIIILTHALVHASKHPPPPSHPTARPPTRPCAITQRCKRRVSANGRLVAPLQSRTELPGSESPAQPCANPRLSCKGISPRESDTARHDAPFAIRRNNSASPPPTRPRNHPCRPLTPTSLEAGLRYDVTRFIPRGALGTNL